MNTRRVKKANQYSYKQTCTHLSIQGINQSLDKTIRTPAFTKKLDVPLFLLSMHNLLVFQLLRICLVVCIKHRDSLKSQQQQGFKQNRKLLSVRLDCVYHFSNALCHPLYSDEIGGKSLFLLFNSSRSSATCQIGLLLASITPNSRS